MNFMILLMIILGGISKFYRRFVPVSLGIELQTFFTIIIAYKYPLLGVVSAAVMVVISALISMRFHYWIFVKIVLYSLVCLIVSGISGFGVVVAGKFAILFLNTCFVLINIGLKNYHKMTDLFGNIVNILFNFFLLNNLSDFFLKMI